MSPIFIHCQHLHVESGCGGFLHNVPEVLVASSGPVELPGLPCRRNCGVHITLKQYWEATLDALRRKAFSKAPFHLLNSLQRESLYTTSINIQNRASIKIIAREHHATIPYVISSGACTNWHGWLRLDTLQFILYTNLVAL